MNEKKTISLMTWVAVVMQLIAGLIGLFRYRHELAIRKASHTEGSGLFLDFISAIITGIKVNLFVVIPVMIVTVVYSFISQHYRSYFLSCLVIQIAAGLVIIPIFYSFIILISPA